MSVVTQQTLLCESSADMVGPRCHTAAFAVPAKAPLKGMQPSELGWSNTLGGCLLWAWVKSGCEAAVGHLLGEQIPPILNNPECLVGI